jgi:hypothetical protein
MEHHSCPTRDLAHQTSERHRDHRESRLRTLTPLTLTEQSGKTKSVSDDGNVSFSAVAHTEHVEIPVSMLRPNQRFQRTTLEGCSIAPATDP